jgi:hypothetical protein
MCGCGCMCASGHAPVCVSDQAGGDLVIDCVVGDCVQQHLLQHGWHGAIERHLAPTHCIGMKDGQAVRLRGIPTHARVSIPTAQAPRCVRG